jgi:uncharacterized membrane protein YhaH (DUF805 family)
LTGKVSLQGALWWLAIAAVCFALGAIGDGLLYRRMGPATVPLTGLAMCAAIFAVAWFCVPRIAGTNRTGYWLLGALWLVLTVAFECAEAVLVEHASIDQIVAAYNPLTGNLWLLVVATAQGSPRLVAAIRHLRQEQSSQERTN